MEEKKMVKILVLDDDKAVRDFLTRLLSFKGLEVKCAEDVYKALELAQKERFDLLFLSTKISKIDSFKLLNTFKKANPQSKYVLMTCYAVVDNLLKAAKKEGASGIIEKPFQIEEIMSHIN